MQLSRLGQKVPRSRVVGVFMLLLLVVGGGLGVYLALKSLNTPAVDPNLTRRFQEKAVAPAFVGQKNESADAPSVGRMVRGVIKKYNESSDVLEVESWVAFPDQTITRLISLHLTESTQFLCWKRMIGPVDVEKAALFVGDTQKLYQKDETLIDRVALRSLLAKSDRVSAIISLQKIFHPDEQNFVYQVALLGCAE